MEVREVTLLYPKEDGETDKMVEIEYIQMKDIKYPTNAPTTLSE